MTKRPTPTAMLLLALAAALLPLGTRLAAQGSGSGPSTTPGQRANARTPFQSLVHAEKDFAALSLSKGKRDAFLANLADTAVVFSPLPTNGPEAWRTGPVPEGVLSWEPAFAEVSASGDFGFTTGPWRLETPTSAGEPDRLYGDYLTVWQRQGKSAWKVVLDIGISHAKPEVDAKFTSGPSHSTAAAAKKPPDASALRGCDMLLSQAEVENSEVSQASRWGAPDLRYLRESQTPLSGDEALTALGTMSRGSRWSPVSGAVARSGDLGFTYGFRERVGGAPTTVPDSSVYVHVWRMTDSGGWRLAAAIDKPLARRKS